MLSSPSPLYANVDQNIFKGYLSITTHKPYPPSTDNEEETDRQKNRQRIDRQTEGHTDRIMKRSQ
jgi:hypothetical protein